MSATAPPPPARAAGPPSVAARNLVVGLALTFFALAWAGDLLLSVLLDRHPAVFIALNSRNRNLVLAKGYLDWWSFFGIATVRLLASDPLFFLLGRWYGDAGVRWIEKRSPSYGALARGAERWFGKAAYPLVVIAPNNYICLFAGAGGMGLAAFWVLNVTGTVARLALLWFITDSFADPLDWVRQLIVEHRMIVFVASFALLALSLWADRRAGGTEVDALLHLDEEMRDADGPTPADGDAAPPDAPGHRPGPGGAPDRSDPVRDPAGDPGPP